MCSQKRDLNRYSHYNVHKQRSTLLPPASQHPGVIHLKHLLDGLERAGQEAVDGLERARQQAVASLKSALAGRVILLILGDVLALERALADGVVPGVLGDVLALEGAAEEGVSGHFVNGWLVGWWF